MPLNECPHNLSGCKLKGALEKQKEVGEAIKRGGLSAEHEANLRDQQKVIAGQIRQTLDGCVKSDTPDPGCNPIKKPSPGVL